MFFIVYDIRVIWIRIDFVLAECFNSAHAVLLDYVLVWDIKELNLFGNGFLNSAYGGVIPRGCYG